MKQRPTPPATGRTDAGRGILPPPGHSLVADALRHWEPRRALYNAVLASVVAAVFATHRHAFVQHASLDLALLLFVLAVVANVAFCAAYPADLFVQWSGLRGARDHARRALFVAGTLFAAVLAQFIARGMLGGV